MVVVFAIWLASMTPVDRLYAWRALGVPSLTPAFADAQVITTGWDCTRLGLDVLVANPCDHWQRPVNYPRIWTFPAYLGLGVDATTGLALASALAFIVALLALMGSSSVAMALGYALALASPPVLLTIERGNNDMIVFALIVASALLIGHGRGWPASAAIVGATVLKLYPVVSLTALPRRREQLAVGAIAGAYFIIVIDDIAKDLAATPRFGAWSYGLVTAAATFLPSLAAPAAVALTATAIGLGAALVARDGRIGSQDPTADAAFVMGASIYLSTFILGPSWDYRLIFLILTLPLLFERVRARRPASFILVMLALWLSQSSDSPLFALDQTVKVMLAAWLLGALIGRLRQPASIDSEATISPVGSPSVRPQPPLPPAMDPGGA